jgi:hypothetical protein
MTKEIQELIKKIRAKLEKLSSRAVKRDILNRCFKCSVNDKEIFNALFQEFYQSYTEIMYIYVDDLDTNQLNLVVKEAIKQNDTDLIKDLMREKRIQGNNYHTLFKNQTVNKLLEFVNDTRTTDEEFDLLLEKIKNKRAPEASEDLANLAKIVKEGVRLDKTVSLACEQANAEEIFEISGFEKVHDENYDNCVQAIISRNYLYIMIPMATSKKTNQTQFNQLLEAICKNEEICPNMSKLIQSKYITDEQITKLIERFKNSSPYEVDLFNFIKNKKVVGANLDKMLDIMLDFKNKNNNKIFYNEPFLYSLAGIENIAGKNLDKIVNEIRKTPIQNVSAYECYNIARLEKVTGTNFDILVDILCEKNIASYIQALASNTKTTGKNFEKLVKTLRETKSWREMMCFTYSKNVHGETYNELFDDLLNCNDIFAIEQLAENKKNSFEQFCQLVDKIKGYKNEEAQAYLDKLSKSFKNEAIQKLAVIKNEDKKFSVYGEEDILVDKYLYLYEACVELEEFVKHKPKTVLDEINSIIDELK